MGSASSPTKRFCRDYEDEEGEHDPDSASVVDFNEYLNSSDGKQQTEEKSVPVPEQYRFLIVVRLSQRMNW